MIFKDYYKILGLDNSKVNFEEIKIAYREQAKKYHPDVSIGNKYSEERFKDINEAYRVLSEHASKRKYDRMWNTHVGKKKEKFKESTRAKDSIFSDFFNMFFGTIDDKIKSQIKKDNIKTQVKGENIDTEIEVSLEEAFYGLEKNISLRTINGKMKTFTIKIPAGIRNNEKIRLLGQGKPGENGGKNGDLFIKVKIKNNKKFKLKGYDIYTDLLITPWEAVLGTKIQIQTIDDQITITVPKGTQTGDMVSIPEKGYKNIEGGRGNLIAEIKIMIPKELISEEMKLFKKLSEISTFNPR